MIDVRGHLEVEQGPELGRGLNPDQEGLLGRGPDQGGLFVPDPDVPEHIPDHARDLFVKNQGQGMEMIH